MQVESTVDKLRRRFVGSQSSSSHHGGACPANHGIHHATPTAVFGFTDQRRTLLHFRCSFYFRQYRVVFSSALICLSVRLTVSGITAKPLDRVSQKLAER